MNISYHSEHQAIYHLRRASAHRQALCNGYALLADRQRDWLASNPGATVQERDSAMRRLAHESGV